MHLMATASSRRGGPVWLKPVTGGERVRAQNASVSGKRNVVPANQLGWWGGASCPVRVRLAVVPVVLAAPARGRGSRSLPYAREEIPITPVSVWECW